MYNVRVIDPDDDGRTVGRICSSLKGWVMCDESGDPHEFSTIREASAAIEYLERSEYTGFWHYEIENLDPELDLALNAEIQQETF